MSSVESAAVEMVNKKIRNQRKRLVKIEKYETLDRLELNPDQIETISRKSEVLGVIKELEGVLETILATEKQARLEDLLYFVGKLHFACAVPVSSLVGTHSVSEAEFMTIMHLKKCLQETEGKRFDFILSSSAEEFSKFATKAYFDLFTQKSTFFDGTNLTCEETYSLIMRLLSPSPEPKFGMFEASRAAEPVKSSLSADAPVRMPAFPSAINFLNPSCLELKELNLESQLPSEKTLNRKGDKKKKLRKPYQKSLPMESNTPIH